MSHTQRQIIGYTISDVPAFIADRQLSTYVGIDRTPTITVRYVGLFAVVPETKPLRIRQTGGYVISKTIGTLQVRRLDGYVVQKVSPTGQVRKIDGYVLVVQPRAIVKNKTGKDALLDLMNQNAKLVFTYDTITIGVVTYDPTGAVAGKNSKVKITAKGDIPYGGSNYLYYDRTLIERLFDNRAWTISVGTNTTLRALVPLINSAYGVNMVPEEIEDRPVLAGAAGVRITVNNLSYMWIPNCFVALGVDPGPYVETPSLASRITVRQMDGFSEAR